MDGFAVPEGDLPEVCEIVGECLPGQRALVTPSRGQAIRVYTGSALPPKVRVVMQEFTAVSGTSVSFQQHAGPSNVRVRGSTARKGDLLLPCGALLNPAGIAILASVGLTHPLVFPRPKIASLTTGSEIVDCAVMPREGQIRNTNAPLLRALVERCGAHFSVHAHVDETLEMGRAMCHQPAFEEADVLLVSGGASGGAHDHTSELLESLGFKLICRRVHCRPGKPLLVGVREDKIAFGLPGNPLSHFVTFHLFVRPVLDALMGRGFPGELRLPLRAGAELERDGRETFWPGVFEEGGVRAVPWLDSGHLGALASVNALIRVPSSSLPQPGEVVQVVRCAL
jgi:molybdopterin molybdotransferase